MPKARPPYHGYTGVKDSGDAIERLVWLAGRRWRVISLGTYVDRDKRGKEGQKSVHADYRAADIRFMSKADRKQALSVFAGLYGVELVIDYQWTGTKLRRAWGRGWRCDRGRWQNYKQGQISGGGQNWADWLHIELAPGCDPDRLEAAFRATKKVGKNGIARRVQK